MLNVLGCVSFIREYVHKRICRIKLREKKEVGTQGSYSAVLITQKGQRQYFGMAQNVQRILLAAIMAITVFAPHFTAQPPTADDSISKDRALRQTAAKNGNIATKPKWGFFGTIFHLILEQVNDTKSAYNQISELLSNQFVDDNAVTMSPASSNGTTETPKISRAEFLKILDRNLKGLARLRALEWREAKKDSMANLQKYKEELFGGPNKKNGR